MAYRHELAIDWLGNPIGGIQSRHYVPASEQKGIRLNDRRGYPRIR